MLLRKIKQRIKWCKMININYVFFEEFKKLEKLLSDIYKSHNGVTHYIDDMTAVSYSNYRSIPNWETDLNQLKRLRHIRNNLAHVEGAFNENVCTQDDIEWVQAFYERILNQSDPLAVQYRNSKTYVQTPITVPKNNNMYNFTYTKKSSSLLTTIIIFSTIVILAVLIALIVS